MSGGHNNVRGLKSPPEGASLPTCVMQILLAVIPFSDITKVDPIRDSCRRDGSRSLFMMMGLYSACAG